MALRRRTAPAANLPVIHYTVYPQAMRRKQPLISFTSDTDGLGENIERCAHQVPKETQLAARPHCIYIMVPAIDQRLSSEQLEKAFLRFYQRNLATLYTLQKH